ncbi:MAG: hypothetical protein NTW06_05090, partial [Candidatus Falkowbacteria bacterium]|nr:hypothetical protein [Candidatus Falkowbacteria bacterium]
MKRNFKNLILFIVLIIGCFVFTKQVLAGYKIILPTSPNGDETTCLRSSVYGTNYQTVRAVDGSFVYTTGIGSFCRDLYNLEDMTYGDRLYTGSLITNVSVSIYVQSSNAANKDYGRYIKTHGVRYNATTTNNFNYWNWIASSTWDVNPYTNKYWTYDELNDLQAGVGLTAGFLTSAQCDYEYVWITYNRANPYQNYYRFYTNNITSTSSLSALEATNTAPTDIAENQQVRLRLTVLAVSGPLATGTIFKLQYGATSSATQAACISIPSGNWTDVGASGSIVDWRFYDNSSLIDKGTLDLSLLSGSSTLESYMESNPSTTSPKTMATSTNGEWDWSLHNYNGAATTSYCFRLVESDVTAFTSSCGGYT